MLTGLVNAGFQIVGTWPMRTERSTSPNAMAGNTLASSVVLVCRPRPESARVATRRQFLNALEEELPSRLDQLTRLAHIAPVTWRRRPSGRVWRSIPATAGWRP